ncbi:Glycerol kinase [Babesia sp. Xinjiang]|uniref:Glycerol kinase n=1 Tax=Babesia sp. Xinjiang TaxID=462227 RepID=UPI000A23A278|nr:Glycerol kinase [Babesia sp. Xinjiang]ORM40504.1 Glycerol kinase [Babesia sp. Xinjiang]
MKVIAAIDQGTQSTRCIFYDEQLQPLATASKKHKQHYPQSGWCEHDPLEIMESVYATMNDALTQIKSQCGEVEIVGVGITNQRETIVAWDAETGKPLHNAIVWLDIRAEAEAQELITQYGSATFFVEKTGLVINSYFSGELENVEANTHIIAAIKLMWMSNNLPWFKEAVEKETVRLGTIDTWIIYNLTGKYATDVTNASRTLLMDINKGKWSSQMLRVFDLNVNVLPEILPNCADFGIIDNTNVPEFKNVKITASIGDQQSACIGHGIFETGATKLTLGTGGFVLTNTGTKRVRSTGGLLCTPCYKLGQDSDMVYALEGSIAIVGAGITWLKEMGMINTPSEISDVLRECSSSGGVVFVPAFSGLFAPRWRADARGCIMGMTQHTKRKHIIRAFCESIAFQLREILQFLLKDMDMEEVPYICVDGGISKNAELLQLISDIVETHLGLSNMLSTHLYSEVSGVEETTCAGAAMLAGIQAGVWSSIDHVRQFISKRPKRWTPQMSEDVRKVAIDYWNLGVNRSMLWQL